MKYLLLLLVWGALLSCSKPGGEATSTADSSAHTGSSHAGQVISLTPNEMERVNFEIFLMLHNEQLYDGDPEVMAYKEEFTTNGNAFTYVLLRHNGSNAGWHSGEEDEGSEPYGESGTNDTYTNEIDTVEIIGRYMAFSSSPPESQLKTVRLVFTGKLKRMNVPYETYGEIKTTVEEVPLDSELIVELGTPAQLTADLLPLKAKMADLTDEDLAGLSREQLAYVRNEIFARHGHTFKTEKMIAYFAKKEWYHTLVDDAQPLLNKFEKRNVDFIKKMEG